MEASLTKAKASGKILSNLSPFLTLFSNSRVFFGKSASVKLLNFSSKALIIGLTTSPDRLIQIRKSRLNSVGEKRTTNYIEEDLIKEEVLLAKKLFLKNKWPIIDVTRKSIEETAAAALEYLRVFREKKEKES